ncbi:MAG: hypothetical protein ACM3U2_13785 [Deltaproteobacteria bacterium]
MNRKRAVITGGLVSLLALLVGGLFLSLRYQPTFYKAALAPPVSPEVRREQAKVFVQTTLQLVDEIRNENSWSHEFSEEAVNGWLAEELPVKYGAFLPPEVAAPRVKFENGKLLLAFQVRHGMWTGVVSGKVRPWVAGPNQLALEFESARIGLIPVPVDELLGDLLKNMNRAGWQMQWRNSGKHDVLIVEFDDDFSPESSGERAILEAVDLEPGLLRISGRRSLESAEPPRVADKPAAK